MNVYDLYLKLKVLINEGDGTLPVTVLENNIKWEITKVALRESFYEAEERPANGKHIFIY